MEFRCAVPQELPRLQALYGEIVRNMLRTGLSLWNDLYPACCFPQDLRRQRLYVLSAGEKLLAAFALCGSHPGEAAVAWRDRQQRALYLERLGVNVWYLRQGIGSLALQKAKEEAGRLGAEELRLFAAECNQPAIRLYERSGFTRAGGVYLEEIDDGFTLREYGFWTSVTEQATQKPCAAERNGGI